MEMVTYKYTFSVQFHGNGAFVGIKTSTSEIGFATDDNCLGVINDSIYKQFNVLGEIHDIIGEINVRNGCVYISIYDGIRHKRVFKEILVGEHKFIHRNCTILHLDIQPSKYRIKRHSTSAVDATRFAVRCQKPFSLTLANFISGERANKVRIYKGNIMNLATITEAAHDEFAYTTADVVSQAVLIYVLYVKPYSSVVYEGAPINCEPNEFLLFAADWPIRMYFGFAKKIYKQDLAFPPYELEWDDPLAV